MALPALRTYSEKKVTLISFFFFFFLCQFLETLAFVLTQVKAQQDDTRKVMKEDQYRPPLVAAVSCCRGNPIL